MVVQLKIRDIRTGKAQVAELQNLDDAEAWLRARPKFVEVLGPATRDALAPGDDARLRQAMRPLDDEEKAALVEQEQRDADAIRKAIAAEQAVAQQRMTAQREENRNADPNRIMYIVWERGQGVRNTDVTDERPVTDVAKQAIDAWVAEREQWVHPRQQYLIDAQIAVWPGPLPPGESDRIQPGGQFNTAYGTPPEDD